MQLHKSFNSEFNARLLDINNSSSVEASRTEAQMFQALKQLNWSKNQLSKLLSALQETIDHPHKTEIKTANIQSFRAKLVKLAKQYNCSYDEIISYLNE